MSSGDELKDKILLYRNIMWQHQLDQYTTESLKTIQKALNLGRNELLNQIDMMDFRLPEGREHAVLAELNDMTFGIQATLTGNIQEAAAIAGEASYREYGNILSFDGKLAETVGFDFVSLSPSQLRAMAVTVPVGGKLMQDWVKDTFESHIVDDIHTAIMADNLKGVSTPQIIERLTDTFGLIQRDAETLARTYIASVNNAAAADVYKANSDIVKKERWDATFEVSTKSGSGTCMRCAALHGKEFPIEDEHIRPPIHHRCRCNLLPVTISWRELGLDIDEMKASLKPFTERDENRKILDVGQIEGSFDDFLKTRSVKYQKGFFGENRYRMWKDGEIKVDDLIDKNGDLRLLNKNRDGLLGKPIAKNAAVKPVFVPKVKIPPKPVFVPAKTFKDAESWAVKNGIAESVSYKKLDIDIANAINENLFKLKQEHGFAYDSISVVNRKKGSYGDSAMWNLTTPGEDGTFTSDLIVNKGFLDRYKTQDELVKSIKQGRDEKWWVAESFNDMVNHEYGHLLTSMPVHQAKIAKNSIYDNLEKVFDYDNLGKYASSSIAESLAEIFARYKKDGFIKDEWKEMFNSVSRAKIK